MKRQWAVVAALVLVVCQLAWGQLTRGFISGTVSDPTGAVVTGATVTITNKGTGAEQSAPTNASGFFRFTAVEPGNYDVSFTAPGFEGRKITNVGVSTNQEVVLNETLKVGQASTTLEIVEAPTTVELQKASATVERTFNNKIIENIPLTGALRDPSTLALLAPTAARGPGSTGISANGQRARNNNFLIDGVDNNDASITVSAGRTVPEGLVEFQVQTSPYSAEFGRSSGAQISAITKSGTNEFHGGVYDYYRGNWMEPLNLLNKRAGLTATPRFVQNQAGGFIGGPIVKNRLFFFSLLEANRRREAPDARNASNVTTFTPAGFAALQNVPLGEGQTAASRQAALNGLSFLPDVYASGARFNNLRNITINGVPVQVGGTNIPLPQPFNFWFVQNRVDYRISDRDTINYRHVIDKRETLNLGSNLGFGSRFASNEVNLTQNHSASYTRTFNPTLVNELRASFVRRNLAFPENDPNTPTTGITGAFTIGGLSNFPQGRVQNTYQLQNVTTWLLGTHSVKFGVDARQVRLFNLSAFDSKGTFTFDSLGDFINGRPATFVQALQTASFDAKQWSQFYFAQDDWRIRRDLTLTFGLRYEYNTVPLGFFGATDPQVRGAVVPAPVRPDRNNFAPRAGFAYSPSGQSGVLGKLLGDGKTVFRGGYGVGYDVLFFNILTVNASNFPRVVVGQRDRADLVNVWPRLLPVSATPRFDPLAGFVNSPTDIQSPTTHFYSFSIQRQFGRNILELGYSGNRSYHQIRQGQANPGTLTEAQAAQVRAANNPNVIPGLLPTGAFPTSRRIFPQFGARTLIETTAKQNYNAVYVRFDRQFTNGLQFGGNYTFSANLADNDESLGVAAITNSSSQQPQDWRNYGNEWGRSAFDRPHRAVAYWGYDVPWFKGGVLGNKFLTAIFGGWNTTGFTEAQSGQPFTVRTGVDTYGVGAAGAARPDWNPAGALTLDPVTGNFRTFTTPLVGGRFITPLNATTGLPLANSQARFGNLGRNTFRGPGFINTNLSVSKRISITERVNLLLRNDFINAFNQRNFGNPVVLMNNPQFGQNTTDPGNRTMLLSAKITF